MHLGERGSIFFFLQIFPTFPNFKYLFDKKLGNFPTLGGEGVTEKVEKSCSIKVLPDLLLTGVAMKDLGERLVSPRELFSVSTNWCKKK